MINTAKGTPTPTLVTEENARNQIVEYFQPCRKAVIPSGSSFLDEFHPVTGF